MTGLRRKMMVVLAGGAALVCAALFVVAQSGCFQYYRWEKQTQNVAKADVILVPGMKLTRKGLGTYILHNRVAMAKHLMDEGYAPKMIVSGGNPRAGVTEAAKMMEVATRLGVPPEKILAEPQATTSVENAKYSAALMKALGFQSALVVTDAPHLGYALPVFRDAFEPEGLSLYWIPVDYERLHALGISRRKSDPPQ